MTSCIFHDTTPSLLDVRVFEIVQETYEKQQKVVIFAHNLDRAHQIDRFLWIMRQESFIPHDIVTESEPKSPTPVAIVTGELNPIGADILVADGHCSLGFALSFERIHEFVNRSTPQLHAACRERFRAYRDRKVKITHVRATGTGESGF